MAGVAVLSPNHADCLQQLHRSALQLLSIEGARVPTWQELCQGDMSPDSQEEDDDDGNDEWRPGWQYYMSNHINRKMASDFRQSLTSSELAVLRSGSGPHCAPWLHVIPYENGLSLDDAQFRVSMLRRLYLPASPFNNPCPGCRNHLDQYGFHRTTCMRTGVVHARHKVLVNSWKRLFKEIGVNIPRRDVERPLRLTHIRRSENDNRRMDLITRGLSGIFGGKPLFMDATCISPIHGNGLPMVGAADHDGACLHRKDDDTYHTDYPDVFVSPHAKLLSLSVETYGRWGSDSLSLVRQMAQYKAADLPACLQRSVAHSFSKRAWGVLSICLQKIITDSIIQEFGADLIETFGEDGPDGQGPSIDLLSDMYR